MRDLLDKIEQRAAARPEHPVPPSLELVGFVVRSPMGSQRAIRELAPTYAVLFHHPGVPGTYNGEIANLRDWLDLANSIVLNAYEEPSPERGRRDLYNDIIGCVRDFAPRG